MSCSPFSAALVGVFLKKLTRKPLVLDFRDPFVTGVASHFTTSRLRKRILAWFERKFVENTDVLLVTSEETRAEYVKAYPGIADKMFTIYNGFDPRGPVDEPAGKFEKFSIIYTGQFYRFGPNHQVHTDQFFKALAHLKAARETFRRTTSSSSSSATSTGTSRRPRRRTASPTSSSSRSRVPYRRCCRPSRDPTSCS